jgi:hypothetical protein
MKWEKIEKKDDYILYITKVIDLKIRVYEMEDKNKVYINYKGYNVATAMLIWEFGEDLNLASLYDVKLEDGNEGDRDAYFAVSKENTDRLLEEIYFFLVDYNMDAVCNDGRRVNWEE